MLAKVVFVPYSGCPVTERGITNLLWWVLTSGGYCAAHRRVTWSWLLCPGRFWISPCGGGLGPHGHSEQLSAVLDHPHWNTYQKTRVVCLYSWRFRISFKVRYTWEPMTQYFPLIGLERFFVSFGVLFFFSLQCWCNTYCLLCIFVKHSRY